MKCLRCGREIAAYNDSDPLAYRRYTARGMDKSCHRAASTDGTLIDYPRQTWDNATLLSEARLLMDRGLTRRQAAERLGIKDDSLYQAMRRAAQRQEKEAA